MMINSWIVSVRLDMSICKIDVLKVVLNNVWVVSKMIKCFIV